MKSLSDRRRNTLRAIRFETPDCVPMTFVINRACWNHYPRDFLLEQMERHPLLFPDADRPEAPEHLPYEPVARRDRPYTDDFGCVWKTAEDGITGTVVGHPLADWAAFDSFSAPDPEVSDGLQRIDWNEKRRNADDIRKNGGLIDVGLRHGHTFLQLCDLRGYQALLFDMADEEARLLRLIDLLEAFNLALVHRYLSLEPDILRYPEDLGMQIGPMLSPDQFRRYIRPSYERLIKPALDRGVIVHMHSDGDIRTLCDDLLLAGVEVLNLQDTVNGVDWIAARYAGKICVDLDLDRQFVTQKGTPRQIDEHIRGAVEKIGSRRGGLMMIYGLYPGVPLENVKAVMDSMETYALYYA